MNRHLAVSFTIFFTTVHPMLAIRYRITPIDPNAHLFEVRCTVAPSESRPHVRLALPAWIPGSYMVREFARNIVEIRAEATHGRTTQAVNLIKLEKHSWQVEPCVGTITVIYTIYAWDLSVRCAHLDQFHGFFNGTGVFLRVLGEEHLPHEVDIRRPVGARYRSWRVATSLPELAAKRYAFGTYRAENYDELVDHPVEMGDFELISFIACGTRHDIAVTGNVPALDAKRLATDLERICSAQIRFFEPGTAKAPFTRYVFLVMAIGDGYGGLEHRASTALICKRDDLPVVTNTPLSDGYASFLGLASHEYFHAWNVKRIKPASFVPYDFGVENYTTLLWIFEGFTSYYDDLFLLRAGLIDTQRYLNSIAKNMSTVFRGSGRNKQSVAESSYDAWIKYYRQDENAPNAIVSYYAKGALVALALDLHLRRESGGRKSLDDVMRMLWQRFGREFYQADNIGLGENEFPRIVQEATGVNVTREVRAWAYGKNDIPLKALFSEFAIELSAKPARPRPTLGVKFAANQNECTLTHVYDGGAAQAAGLSAHDIVIALEGLRVTGNNLDTRLARFAIGDTVEIYAFRRDELLRLKVCLQAEPPLQFSLTPLTKKAGAKLRQAWLSS